MARDVGIVGLGVIGAGAARALAGNGFALRGFDVRAEVLEALPVEPAGSPAEVGGGLDVVLIAVMDDAQVREVVAGLLSAETPPRVAVILSTVTLDTIRWAAAEGRAHGMAVLDCGVSGGGQALEHASITAMLGGDDAAVALARPVLEGFADPVVHCGELGNGMRAKLARNLIIYTDWMVAWEAARLALAAGVPLDRFVECVTASDRWVKPHMHLVDHGIGLGSEANAERTAGYADKDLRAALALGDELGLDLPAAQLALARFRAVAGLD